MSWPDALTTIAPYLVAIISVLGVIYSTRKSKDNQLATAYFNKMTDAYERLMTSFAGFVYHRRESDRDALSFAVYTSVLYANEPCARKIQASYDAVMDAVRYGQIDGKYIDNLLGELESALHEDIALFRSRAGRASDR